MAGLCDGCTAMPRTRSEDRSDASAGFVAMLVVSGLGFRYGWSRTSSSLSILGAALTVFGFVVIFSVYRSEEGSETERRIR
jgi:hypothetical protein